MKIVGNVIKGLLCGFATAICLFVLGFGLELLNLAWMILTCDCNGGDLLPWLWSGDMFVKIAIFTTILGGIIGFVYGQNNMKEAARAEAERQNAEMLARLKAEREQLSITIKGEAQASLNYCNSNLPYGKPVVQGNYQSAEQMKNILNELTKVVELHGQVDSVATQLAVKGGDS